MTSKYTPIQPTGKKPYFFEYYVVFAKSDHVPRIWRYLLRDKFEHCSVFMAVGDKTIQIEQTVFGIRAHFFDSPVDEFMKKVAEDKDNFTVVYLPRASTEPYKNTIGTIIPTCVSLTMRITGLTCGSITPYSYCKFLLKNGGTQIQGGQ